MAQDCKGDGLVGANPTVSLDARSHFIVAQTPKTNDETRIQRKKGNTIMSDSTLFNYMGIESRRGMIGRIPRIREARPPNFGTRASFVSFYPCYLRGAAQNISNCVKIVFYSVSLLAF